MDLRHHIKVWLRWWVVLALGLALAIVMAVLVTFKPVLSGGSVDLKWRSKAVYETTSRLFVTQPGFPWGRATLPGTAPDGSTTNVKPQSDDPGEVDFADPGRFSNLAIVYSYLAQSDQVRALITPLPAPNQISVVYQATGQGDALPLLQLTTRAGHPVAAQQLNEKAIRALRTYLDRQLSENGVPEAQRVQLQVLNPAEVGTIISGRSPTLSVVAFVLVMVGAVMLIYILENLYPPKATRPALRLEDRETWSQVAAERLEKASPSA